MTMLALDDASRDLRELASVWPLCFEFKPPANYTAIVAGAYQGKVVELLARLYPYYERIIGFEPQKWAADKAIGRLQAFPRTPIMPWAIGVQSGDFPMGEWNTDSCSFINTEAREKGNGLMVEFRDAMRQLEVSSIDLAVFNMEGYEYLLLPHLRSTGWAQKIDRLATQWHVNLGAGGYEEMNAEVDEWVYLGHRIIYDHRPQWTYTENWKRWEDAKVP